MASWEYDQTVDALYIRASASPIDRQKVVSDAVVFDLDEAGRVVGVEVLGASLGWDAAVFDRFDIPSAALDLLRHLSSFAGFRTAVTVSSTPLRRPGVAHARGSGELTDRGLIAIAG